MKAAIESRIESAVRFQSPLAAYIYITYGQYADTGRRGIARAEKQINVEPERKLPLRRRM